MRMTKPYRQFTRGRDAINTTLSSTYVEASDCTCAYGANPLDFDLKTTCVEGELIAPKIASICASTRNAKKILIITLVILALMTIKLLLLV